MHHDCHQVVEDQAAATPTELAHGACALADNSLALQAGVDLLFHEGAVKPEYEVLVFWALRLKNFAKY